MRFRQVHLDFHTSEKIPAIGADFSKEQFKEMLKLGHVNSITVFAKCHHGWSYYPSQVNPIHPQLKIDLLSLQLEACKELGVLAPIYISAGFDEKEVLLHPEWLLVSPEGTEKSIFTSPHYHTLCLNTSYLDRLIAQVEEVMTRFDPCGIFLDIVNVRPCVCAACVKEMLKKGLDPNKEEDIQKQAEDVYAHYLKSVEKAVRKYSATCKIFHNSGHIAHGRRDLAGYDTHFELESLPTGGWGYDHFPMSAAYVRTLGKEYLGMTGKFHTTWGEFGGFKHPNALLYETSLSLACGAAISIGDQLHPGGKMNPSTYELIGKAFKQVEEKEPYCAGAKNLSDVAVLSSEAFYGQGRNHPGADSNAGANRILLESKILFDFIDWEASFDSYKVLILPDCITLTTKQAERLNAFMQKGGKILLTGESGMDLKKTKYLLDIGAKYAGKTPYTPDYLVPAFNTVNGKTEYVMYTPGQLYEVVSGSVFAYRQAPYFNRAPFSFSSHQHTPNNPQASLHPAAFFYRNLACIGWNVFADYAAKGELVVKELVRHAVFALLGQERSVSTNLPDRGVITVTKQGKRKIVHLLFAYTSLRGKNIEVVEDAVPLYDISVSLRCSKAPLRVYLAPQKEELPFTYENGLAHFTVPRLLLHQMVAVEEE